MTPSIYFPPSNWLAQFFENQYPFCVWEERLRHLSEGGALDVHVYLVVETLLAIAEAYVTLLTGSFLNPGFRWMSIEQFSPPQRIAKLTSLLCKPEGWKEIFADPEFVNLDAVAESRKLSDKELFSTMLGNPASKRASGEIFVTYDPEWLISLAQAVASFREEHRGLLNAIKHGFRLPRYSDYSIDTLATAFEDHGQSLPYSSEEVRRQLQNASLVPAFWLLESDPAGKKDDEVMEGPKAELRLYAVEPHRALAHSRLVLEMLKLLFDTSRESSRLVSVASRLAPPFFGGVLEVFLRLFVPIRQLPGDEPFVVSAFVR